MYYLESGQVYEMVLSVLDRKRGRRVLPLDRCHVTDVLPGQVYEMVLYVLQLKRLEQALHLADVT
jgi:hypothetical protein